MGLSHTPAHVRGEYGAQECQKVVFLLLIKYLNDLRMMNVATYYISEQGSIIYYL